MAALVAAASVIAFAGRGIPLRLDSWSGDVAPVARYTGGRGRVTTSVTIPPNDQTVIAITHAPADLGVGAPAVHALSTTAPWLDYADGTGRAVDERRDVHHQAVPDHVDLLGRSDSRLGRCTYGTEDHRFEPSRARSGSRSTERLLRLWSRGEPAACPEYVPMSMTSPLLGLRRRYVRSTRPRKSRGE